MVNLFCYVCADAFNEMKMKRERLNAEMSDKLAQLDRVKAELCDMTAELNQLKSEKNGLEEQLNANFELVKTSEKQQEKLMEFISEQKNSLASADTEKLRLENVVCKYREKAERLSAEHCELEKSLEMLNARHQDEIQQLTASRDNLASENHDLNLRLATKSLVSNPVNDSSVSKLAETCISDRSTVLSEITRASAANLVKEEELLNDAEAERSLNDCDELKLCREELQCLRLTMMEREKSYSSHVAQLSVELESFVAARNADCSDCSSKDCLISELNTKTRLLEDDRQRLTDDLESRRLEFENEKKRTEAEIMQLRKEVEGLKTELNSAIKQPAVYTATDSQTEDIVARLRAEVESLKECLEERDSVCKLYESEVERLTGVENRLSKEIEKQEQAMSKLPQTLSGTSTNNVDEIARLKAHASAMEHELEEARQYSSHLYDKVGELSAEVDRLQHQLHESAAANGQCSSCDVPGGSRTLEVGLAAGVENSSMTGNDEPQNGGVRFHPSTSFVSTDSENSTVSQQQKQLNAHSTGSLLRHNGQLCSCYFDTHFYHIVMLLLHDFTPS